MNGRIIRVLVLMAIVLALPRYLQAEDSDSPRLIHVIGKSELRVAPDQVVISLGIDTVNMDLEKAKAENDRHVKSVFAIAENHEIEARDVQTDYINITPEYKRVDHNDNPVFAGHRVRHNVVITLRDISKYERLISDLLAGGVNRIHDVTFRISNPRPYKDKSRRQAILAAKEKATALAAALDQKIGLPHEITEEPANQASYWWSQRGGSMNSNTMQMIPDDSSLESAIAPGIVAISARVSVSFELID